jgi:hypothetical protein
VSIEFDGVALVRVLTVVLFVAGVSPSLSYERLVSVIWGFTFAGDGVGGGGGRGGRDSNMIDTDEALAGTLYEVLIRVYSYEYNSFADAERGDPPSLRGGPSSAAAAAAAAAERERDRLEAREAARERRGGGGADDRDRDRDDRMGGRGGPVGRGMASATPSTSRVY